MACLMFDDEAVAGLMPNDGYVKVKQLTYSVTTGASNTHYFNNGTANIAKGMVTL